MRLATALALLTLALPAAAQGRWTDTFAVPGVYDGGTLGASVNAVTADGAGALVGGTFRIVNGVEVNNVARWTGAAWEALGGGVRCADCGGSPFPARVQAVVRDAAGAVWVAGTFDTAVQTDGTTLAVDGLARWTGATWDAPGRLVGYGTAPPTGYALLVQSGSVVVAGDFADVRRPDGSLVGTTNVARWSGGAWEPMSQDVAVYALAAGADGRALSAGLVVRPDATQAFAVTAWDGAAWQPVTDALGPGFVLVQAILPDAAGPTAAGLTVGGFFAGGQAADGRVVASRNVVRWDGAAWQPLGTSTPGGGLLGGGVRALARDAVGLLAGGQIDYPMGIVSLPPRGVVRWTGTSWEDVPGMSAVSVSALTSAGAETLVGGTFAVESGSGGATVRASNLAALAGSAWRPLSPRTGRDGTVYADGSGQIVRLAPDGCGGLHVYAPQGAGPLTDGGQSTSRRWDGAAWRPVPLGLQRSSLRSVYDDGRFGPFVAALAGDPQACDAFVVGGSLGGVALSSGARIVSNGVVRWTGAAWQALGRGVETPDGGPEASVGAVAVGPGGVVTVGGRLAGGRNADGTVVRSSSVAQWTPAGGWRALAGGLFDASGAPLVWALLAEADGSVVAGGRFDLAANGDAGPAPARNVARWTGTAWETFGGPLPSFGVPTAVRALVRWNGLLVAGGTFAQVAQPSGTVLDARAVAAWDGTAWRALPGLDSDVSGLAVVDGELFASGGLGQRAARWTGTAWVPLGDDAPAGAFEIVAAGRSLYLGGVFETAGGMGSPALARFDLDGTVSAELPAAAETAALAVFPNPARTSAAFRFRTDAPGYVRITLLDALGRTVAVLADGEMAAGEQTVRADVSRLPAGVYVARVAAGGRVQTQRLTVVR